MAQVSPPQGLPLLLAAPAATELGRFAQENFREAPAGRRLYRVTEASLATYREGLCARGLHPGDLTLEEDGAATLEITDPDGFIVSFWSPAQMDGAERIRRFEAAPAVLVEALTALAEPGRPFRNNPYSQDAWVANLGHDRRPVATAVSLISAVNAHIGALLRHLPVALDRTLEGDLSGRQTVRMMVAMLTAHVHGHTQQILETRQVHGV